MTSLITSQPSAVWISRASDLWEAGHSLTAIAVLVDRDPETVAAALTASVPGVDLQAQRPLPRATLLVTSAAHLHSAPCLLNFDLLVPDEAPLPLENDPLGVQGTLGFDTAETNYNTSDTVGFEAEDLADNQPVTLPRIVESTHHQHTREQAMVFGYATGETLEQIGNAFDLTRERVRQILQEQGLNCATLRRVRKAYAAQTEATEKAAALAWSEANIGTPLSEGATDLDLPEKTLRKRLGRRVQQHVPVTRRRSTRRSDQQILEDIRRFHAETGKTTAAAFDRWASEEGVPGKQTAMIRFDRWNLALAKAGVANRAPVKRVRRHSDTDLWAALLEAVQAGCVTAGETDAWLSDKGGGYPSLALIRNRLALKWADLYNGACAILNGTYATTDWCSEVLEPRNWDELAESNEVDPIGVIREAIDDLGPDLRCASYQDWARERGKPSLATLTRRARMTWTELVTAAGGTPGAARRAWTDRAEVLHILHAFFAEHPGGTIAQYQEWKTTFERPGVSTVATLFGSWADAKEAAEFHPQAE